MERGLNTKCLHIEEEETHCNHYGALNFPIYQTATFAHPGVGQSTGYDYSRVQNPTREQLEKYIAGLEGGIDAIAFSSGMAAISLLFEIFNSGDHIVAERNLYGGSIRLFENVLKNRNYEFTYVNCENDDLEQYIKDNTKAIYIETPTNPMMKVADIEKIGKVAKKHNIHLIVDNTFLSPYFQNPLRLGADIVVHSGTKFISGHNDTLAGFIVTNNREVKEKLRFLVKTTGAVLSPFDSWLVMRGVKTLGIRMERSADNALKIARWLKNQRHIDTVFYPGLPDSPGYKIMKKQARGFGAMLTFRVDKKENALKILENIKLIKFAESLGGVETLITYPATQTHVDLPEEERIKNGITDTILRLSVGIEDAEDLIYELYQVLKQLD